MLKPVAPKHLLAPEAFPLTIQLYSAKTGACVWSRTVTLEEARDLAKIEIPGYAGTEHYPVHAVIIDKDGVPMGSDPQ